MALGLDAPNDDFAAEFSLVKGMAVGRTIYGDVANAGMKGETRDAEMALRFKRLCGIWDEARTNAREAAT